MSEDTCKEKVHPRTQWGSFHPHRCTRKAWKDGYCKQHHPDTVMERHKKSSEKWVKDSEAMLKAQLLNAASPDLLEACKAVIDWQKQCDVTEWIGVLTMVMDAIAKAERGGR